MGMRRYLEQGRKEGRGLQRLTLSTYEIPREASPSCTHNYTINREHVYGLLPQSERRSF